MSDKVSDRTLEEWSDSIECHECTATPQQCKLCKPELLQKWLNDLNEEEGGELSL